MLLLYLVIVLTAQSLAQLTTPGPCPAVSPMANLDKNRILGTWLEWGRIENFYETDLICGNLTYMIGPNETMMEHVEETYHYTGARYTWNGTIIPVDGAPPGVFQLQFPSYSEHKTVTGMFVGADYDNWAILYGCQMMFPANLQYVWILSKTPELNETSVLEIENVISNINIPWYWITQVDQKDCLG